MSGISVKADMQSKDAATHNSPAAKQWGCLFLTQKVRRAKVRGNKFMKLERGKLRRQGHWHKVFDYNLNYIHI